MLAVDDYINSFYQHQSTNPRAAGETPERSDARSDFREGGLPSQATKVWWGRSWAEHGEPGHFLAMLMGKNIVTWLVVLNIFLILPIDELIFFKIVKTTNQ